MKKYVNWKGDFDKFCKAGEEVDEEIFSHFLNVLPPRTYTSSLLQVGEAYSSVGGKTTFPTFRIERSFTGKERYFYCGNCWAGQNKEPKEEF